MGCDIHLVLERKYDDKWIGIHSFEDIPPQHNDTDAAWGSWQITQRDYKLFAALAGVRGEGPDPRGVPGDVSDLARVTIDAWGIDGHSHSWLSLEEALPIFSAYVAPYDMVTEKRHQLSYTLFGVDNGDVQNYRLIFWFDN